jgi:CRP-like cAMP-binding protein
MIENKQAFFFDCLTASEFDLINQNSTEIQYLKKETIFKQKSYASHIMLLKDGLAKLYIEGANGRNIVLNLLKPNDFIEFNALFGNRSYPFSAVALKNTTVLLFDMEPLKKIISSNIAFAEKIMKWYCENTIYAYSKLSSFGTKQMHGRLSDVLLYLAKEDFKSQNIYSYISRKDIAEMAGMSTESAIRLLTEFKNDGLINLNGKSIEINKLELVQRLSLIG